MDYDSDSWYVRENGQVAGPFSRKELAGRWNREELGWQHDVSQDQMIWINVTALDFTSMGEPVRRSKPSGFLGLIKSKVTLGILSLVGVIGLVGFSQGLGPLGASSEEATAILRVIQLDDQTSKENMSTVSSNERPAVYAQAIENYVSAMRMVDISDCPADFSEAFKDHLEAWQSLAREVKVVPKTNLEGFFVGFLNGYLFQEVDGGMSRMQENVKLASKHIKLTYNEVRKVAATHGAVIP